jgi:phosphopantothenoylcysteine decarboxylase
MKLLAGITSSIAAYRMPNLISQLRKLGHEIIPLVTDRATAFVTPQSLAVMSQNECYTDDDEWKNTERVIHIELARWCDLFLVAPLSANTLAKLANGICDNLLTSTARALGEKPLVIAPAMNIHMWENPVTRLHLEQLGTFYQLHIIEPIEKVLADGESGIGALAEDETIIAKLQSFKS